MSISKGFFVDIDVKEPAPADNALRRRLLGIGLGGAAFSLLPFLIGRASATTPPVDTTPGAVAPGSASDTPGSPDTTLGSTSATNGTTPDSTAGSTADTTPAPTTTAPPKRPTDADVPLLGFAQTVELAARDLYNIGLGVTGLDDNQRAVLATIRESHGAYAASLSAILGRLAPQKPSTIVGDLEGSFTGDVPTVIQSAYHLESVAVATHTEILGKLQGTDAAALLASILIVEARHGTVLAYLNGSTGLDDLLVNTEADALTPTLEG
jgi:Ferritin-like domain